MIGNQSSASGDGFRNEFVFNMITAGVIGLENHPDKDKFIKGLVDIAIDELHVDSLTKIQIAIQIEEQYGVSLSPDDVSRYATLNRLADAAANITQST